MASDDENEVGYGKPPKASRFKPGQSGNPKGRPQRKTTVEEIYREVFGEVIEVKIDGKTKRMTPLQLTINLLKRDMISGTASERIRALKQIRELVPDLALDDPQVAAAPAITTIEIIRSNGNGRPLVLSDEEILEALERRKRKTQVTAADPLDD